MSHLVARYRRSLAPQTKIKDLTLERPRELTVSVEERYTRIMRLFEDQDGPVMRKYREELLGSSTIFFYGDTYNLVSLGKELVGSFWEFREMLYDPQRIKIAAKMIAQYELSNMVELVQRHDRLQREKSERLAQKNKPKPRKGGR